MSKPMDDLLVAMKTYHESRPEHPLNLNDVFVLAVSFTEALLETRMKRFALIKDEEKLSQVKVSQEQIAAAWAAYQSAARMP